ncbi:MAG TPA: recombinase family protein, partial [Armatimonadota bacterium]
MVAQVKQGRWPGGNLPFGYDVADGRLVPNPAEAPVLRMMFAQYLEVKSTALVRDKLIALGIQTRRANYHGKAPNIISKWSLQKVEYILRNRVYLGELNYDGVRVPEAHEAIIDDDTYALVQGQLGQRFKRPKIDSPHAYFLTGKVYCGDCGCRLTPKSTQHSKRKKAYTPYYQCYRTCKYHGLDCRVGRMNAEVLEGLFVETVSSLSANRDLLARAAEQAGELDTNLSQLELEDSTLATRESELQGKIQNILSALEQGLTSTSVQSRLSELELELGTIRAQRNMVRSKLRESQPEPIDVDAALRLFSRFKELFPTCTPEEKEALVDALLKKAVVGADKTVEFELYAEGDIGDNVVPKNKVGSGARIRT